MIIDTIRQNWKKNGDLFEWKVPENWQQGRSLFGGMTAAAAVALAENHTDRQLRTMQTQLVGPVLPGLLQGQCKIIREGKTTTFIDIQLFQKNNLVGTFTFVFIAPRKNSIKVEGPKPPKWKHPEDCIQFPYLKDITPEFSQNIDFRLAYGGIAFENEKEASTGGYVQFKETQHYDSEHQIALLDAWFPPIYTQLKTKANGSTVTWTAHLFAPSSPGLHQFKYDTLVGEGGFSTSLGHMWDSAGTYVGFTEQTVVIFD